MGQGKGADTGGMFSTIDEEDSRSLVEMESWNGTHVLMFTKN
jgi:hypothetical protein